MKILLIENDLELSGSIKERLYLEGFVVEHSADISNAIGKIKNSTYDLAIVEHSMLEDSALELFKHLNSKAQVTPVLVLGNKMGLAERVKALATGGDDYLAKPFETKDFLSRIELLLKSRIAKERIENLSSLGIHMNIITREVKRGEEKINLHPHEFSLLHLLMEQQNKIVTKTQILEKVWGYQLEPKTNVVDVLVCRLRNKIDKDHEVKTIHTIRGLGYSFRK